MIVDYLAVGRAVLGVDAHAGAPRARAVLRRDRRHAARRALALRRAHQPGARARAAQEVLPHVQLRAPGRGHRRRHRALARPAPQLPARRGARATCSSRTVEDTLEHAILDSPMFQARWRWNLNRSLHGAAVPERPQQPAADPAHGVRRPHGRGVPAGRGVPGERRRPDRDPRPRARAPDHRRHAARGARRRRRCARCSSASRPATVAVHCVDTTEPSVLAHEILTARPYAFLDDEEFQNRRTNAVTLRRGLAGRPRVDRRARPRGHRAGARRDRRPSPTTADDLHDLLALARASPAPATTGGRCGTSSSTAGRGAGARARRRRAVVHHRGARRRAQRASPATTTAVAAVAARPPRDRRHHHRRRARRAPPRSPPARVGAGLAVLEHEGFALQGRYTRRARRHRVGGAPPAGPHALVLAAHPARARRARHRAGLHALPAALAARRARHPARRRGRAARGARAAPGLRGRGGRVGAGAARRAGCATTTRPGSTGSATTARSAGCGSRPAARDDADAPAGAPSKATPISVVFRDDLPWLLEAARGGADPAEPDRRRDRRDPRGAARARRVLRRRARRGHPPPARRHRARAVGRRRPRPAHLRRLRRDPRHASSGRGRRRHRRRAGSPGCCAAPRARGAAAGRWSLVPADRAPTSTATSSPKRSPSCC